MIKTFYTYAFLRKDGTPYYIGKGKGNRAYSKHGRNVATPPFHRILILKKNLTEEEAFRHERYMIAILGRINAGTGILRNTTSGGEGSSGLVWITNNNEEKGIPLGTPVPAGWWLGRKPVSEETRCKLKGRKKNRWINDGKVEKRLSPGEPVPAGWTEGRLDISEETREKLKARPRRIGWTHPNETIQKLKLAAANRQVKYMWITDGFVEKWVEQGSDIPDGWGRGRKKGFGKR